MFRKTVRTLALVVAAAVALIITSQESSAQCSGGFNRGFGGVSVNVGRGFNSGFGGFNSGFGGFNSFNSFGRPSSFSTFRSVPVRSFGHGGFNSFNSFGRSGFRY